MANQSRAGIPYVPLEHDIIIQNVPNSFTEPERQIQDWMANKIKVGSKKSPLNVFQPLEPGWNLNDWVIECETEKQFQKVLMKTVVPKWESNQITFLGGVAWAKDNKPSVVPPPPPPPTKTTAKVSAPEPASAGVQAQGSIHLQVPPLARMPGSSANSSIPDPTPLAISGPPAQPPVQPATPRHPSAQNAAPPSGPELQRGSTFLGHNDRAGPTQAPVGSPPSSEQGSPPKAGEPEDSDSAGIDHGSASKPEDKALDGDAGGQPSASRSLKPSPLGSTKQAPSQIEMGELKFKQDGNARGVRFTEGLGPESKGDPGEIYANYVQIRNWPQVIYEYSIDFGAVVVETQTQPTQPNQAGNTTRRLIRIAKLQEKKSILRTLAQNPPLAGARWATDYNNTIWSLDKLTSFKCPVHYFQPSGRTEIANNVMLEFIRELGLPAPFGPDDALQLTADHESRERIIQALNAFVSKDVDVSAQNNHVKQIAPNKFFAKKVFSELGNDNFRAHRGFSTSVRPTADRLLLSIAPLTSAFYRPVTAHTWLWQLDHPDGFHDFDDMLRTLIGVRCRIVYDRPQPDPNTPNPNHEHNRYKTITEFGRYLRYDPKQQYRPRPAQGSNAVPPLATVESFFGNLIAQHPHEFEDQGREITCVNVGQKLKRNKKPLPKDMSEKDRAAEYAGIRRILPPDYYDNFDKAIWIPANLLEIEPMQVYSQVLKPQLGGRMIKVACQPPPNNRAWIEQKGFDFLGLRNSQAAGSWMTPLNLDINPSLIRVKAKFQNSPSIKFDRKTLDATDKYFKEASWNLFNTRFIQPCTVSSVCVIHVYVEGYSEPADPTLLVKTLAAQFKIHGINCPTLGNPSKPNFGVLDWGLGYPPNNLASDTDLRTEVDGWFTSLLADNRQDQLGQRKSQVKGPKLAKDSLFIFVIPREKPANVYQALKRGADYSGLRSMCVVSEKITQWKGKDQYASNLCLKINAKAARDVHHVPYLQTLKDTIVLGADIGSVKGGPLGCPSVACVVGTVDANHMNMPGSMRLIPARQDMIPHDAMMAMVKERLLAWAKKNRNKLPTSILMYRDGVSQSQYAHLLERDDGSYYGLSNNTYGNSKSAKQRKPQIGEVMAIYDAYQSAAQYLKLEKIVEPKLTFVVVGKRHNTRFFPAHDAQQREDGNLIPGALVESGCTLPNEWPVNYNFFLQSHQVLKGTGRAAHYVVLKDDNGWAAPQLGTNGVSFIPLHLATHAFCFAYTRATKGVSYCAPAYHADRLCARGQDYLKRVMRDAHAQGYWGPPPAPTAAQSIEQWYLQIATGLATDPLWLTHGATDPGRCNPWHPDLDHGMFWL